MGSIWRHSVYSYEQKLHVMLKGEYSNLKVRVDWSVWTGDSNVSNWSDNMRCWTGRARDTSFMTRNRKQYNAQLLTCSQKHNSYKEQHKQDSVQHTSYLYLDPQNYKPTVA